jgi:hypothetical protein
VTGACMDRCEVCNHVIDQRPDPKRRRCAEHLDQLVLVPAVAIRKPKRNIDRGRTR